MKYNKIKSKILFKSEKHMFLNRGWKTAAASATWVFNQNAIPRPGRQSSGCFMPSVTCSSPVGLSQEPRDRLPCSGTYRLCCQLPIHNQRQPQIIAECLRKNRRGALCSKLAVSTQWLRFGEAFEVTS